MPKDRSVVIAVREELAQFPEDLRESGLAASVLALAKQLEVASSRDVAGIHRELRTSLAELRTAANMTPEEDDAVEAIRNRRPGARV